MFKKGILFIIGIIIIVVVLAFAIMPDLFTARPMGEGIPISYTYCLPKNNGISIIETDTNYMSTHYEPFLIDSSAHFYVKTIVHQKDTFIISTLNYAHLKTSLIKAENASGQIISNKPAGDENGLTIFSSKQGKYLSRLLLPDKKFRSIVVLDYFGQDSLRTSAIFEQDHQLKLIIKCH